MDRVEFQCSCKNHDNHVDGIFYTLVTVKKYTDTVIQNKPLGNGLHILK